MVIIDLKTAKRAESISSFAVALGSFDGVHLGHRRVIEEAVSKARKKGVSSAVWCVTSDAKRSPRGGFLTSSEEKLKIFSTLGVDFAMMEDFSAVKDMSCEAFVGKYLADLGCVGVSCGFNFRFGKGASGDEKILRSLCLEKGIDCTVSAPVTKGNTPVSSTVIRSLVETGETEKAAELLGRNFFLTGEVAHGRTLGKKLGFPTLNQYFAEGKIIPRYGVYFTLVEIDGIKHPAVTNVGSRPTVGGRSVRAESHVLDFDRELYGKTVTVEFMRFRRDEVKLSSEAELMSTINGDVKAAREFFTNAEIFSANAENSKDVKEKSQEVKIGEGL